MSNFGPIHKLIVLKVGDPYGPLSTEEFKEYEIEHPDCTYNEKAERYDCGVAFNEAEGGVRWSLQYAGTPVTKPGEYAIRAWAETYRGFDYTEYDGGIALVDEDRDRAGETA